MNYDGVVFPRIRSRVTQVLDLVQRGVMALEGILRTIRLLQENLEGAFQSAEPIRPLSDATRELTRVVGQLASYQEQLGPAVERLELLELSRVRFEAECEGMLLKADGKLKAASSAEARERQLSKRHEKRFVDPFPADGDGQPPQEGDALYPDHAPASEAEGLLPVRMGVAETPKALALRAKWGV